MNDHTIIRLPKTVYPHMRFVWSSPALKPFRGDLILSEHSSRGNSIEGTERALRAVQRLADASGPFGFHTDLGNRIEKALARTKNRASR